MTDGIAAAATLVVLIVLGIVLGASPDNSSTDGNESSQDAHGSENHTDDGDRFGEALDVEESEAGAGTDADVVVAEEAADDELDPSVQRDSTETEDIDDEGDDDAGLVAGNEESEEEEEEPELFPVGPIDAVEFTRFEIADDTRSLWTTTQGRILQEESSELAGVLDAGGIAVWQAPDLSVDGATINLDAGSLPVVLRSNNGDHVAFEQSGSVFVSTIEDATVVGSQRTTIDLGGLALRAAQPRLLPAGQGYVVVGLDRILNCSVGDCDEASLLPIGANGAGVGEDVLAFAVLDSPVPQTLALVRSAQGLYVSSLGSPGEEPPRLDQQVPVSNTGGFDVITAVELFNADGSGESEGFLVLVDDPDSGSRAYQIPFPPADR